MLRALALQDLEWAGIAVDDAANEATIRGKDGEVQATGSRVKVRWVSMRRRLEGTAVNELGWPCCVGPTQKRDLKAANFAGLHQSQPCPAATF
jgi:hypothetical protein